MERSIVAFARPFCPTLLASGGRVRSARGRSAPALAHPSAAEANVVQTGQGIAMTEPRRLWDGSSRAQTQMRTFRGRIRELGRGLTGFFWQNLKTQTGLATFSGQNSKTRSRLAAFYWQSPKTLTGQRAFCRQNPKTRMTRSRARSRRVPRDDRHALCVRVVRSV